MNPTPRITVCICTFKRCGLLQTLLRQVGSQRTDGRFDVDIVVVDNDRAGSARSVVENFAAASALRVTYCLEPEQNISLARNRAVANASGDVLAFIDDDEMPGEEWLLNLFQSQCKEQVDAVLGPVVPRFETEPPAWVIKGKFFDRPRYPTGRRVRFPEARTGNVLLARGVWRRLDPPFRPQFGTGGEDVDFFRRLSELGCEFCWCDEAAVHELVPAYRCTRGFLIRRALLRGSNFPKQANRLRNVLKSIVAVPCYVLALPLLAVVGQHLFIAYVIKLSDHGSRLLAMAGVTLATKRET